MSHHTDEDDFFLRRYGGLQRNSLPKILHDHFEDVDNENGYSTLRHSPYLDTEKFTSFCIEKKNDLTILSLNIHSLNAKFNEFQVLLRKLKENNFEFSVICLQETWINEQRDLSQFQLDGYDFVSQHYICSSHGGLAFYINSNFMYKLLPLYTESTVWEGQFIELSGENLKRPIIIGNIYRPPRDRNNNYQTSMRF